jgi:TfoX/Sxy family transcriptional regulator of competence genes
MAYDEGLAERIRTLLDDRGPVSERRMFGGLAFMMRGHMTVGIVKDELMVRVGPGTYSEVVREPHARAMDFTGRPMKGFVFVSPAGLESDGDLERWVERGVGYAASLPEKEPALKPLRPKRRTRSMPMSQLLTFPGSLRRDPAVERWFADRWGELGDIARRWFEVIRSCGDDVRELIHDGAPTACVDDAGFAYVNAFKAHVNVGFFRGADLADPKGLLEGTGRFMRHVKLRPGEEVDAGALTALIRAAYDDIKRRLSRGD